MTVRKQYSKEGSSPDRVGRNVNHRGAAASLTGGIRAEKWLARGDWGRFGM
jgi:hypothetical protein